MDGERVGPKEGFVVVGERVGNIDRERVGNAEGVSEGLSVGDTEGICEGL